MGQLNKRQRLLLVWTIRSCVVLLAIVGLAMLTRDRGDASVIPGQQVEGLTSILTKDTHARSSPIRFEDVTRSSGIDFRHFPSRRASLLPEDMGSGIACGDYDGDGLPDLFLVNFAGSILDPPDKSQSAGRCRLYRNLGGFRFEDVTDRAGVGFLGFAMAAAWGDCDNDGDLDLYITAFGDNALYENNGDGTFTSITTRARVGDPRFSSGCAWADYDRDGDLDLYVSNYVDFVLREADRGVTSRQYGSEQPYTLNPSAYQPLPNSLYRNNGDGTFEDVAVTAGVADPRGRSLAVSWVDMNNDGWPDLYVANDISNNGVFVNKGDGTFEDVGPGSLAADYRGAMGIAVGDYDNDLDLDLLITHWIAQENALFRNMFIDPMFDSSAASRLWFLDSADSVGLGQISLDTVGWATGFSDFDNDGRRDLWVINGNTFEQVENHHLLKPQRAFLFWQREDDDFLDVTAEAAPTLAEPFVGRGGVQADFDRDGRVDLAVMVHGGKAKILRNVSHSAGHWLGVKLRQTGGNRFAIGARVYVTAGGKTQMAELGSSASYLSQNDQTLHFGLGSATKVDRLQIVWPDRPEDLQQQDADIPGPEGLTVIGSTEVHSNVSVDQIISFVNSGKYPLR